MQRKFILMLLICVVMASPSLGHSENPELKIVTPTDRAVLQGPVKICMEVKHLQVQPARNGVHEGAGHHHIIFNSLPSDLTQPLGNKQALHLGNGDKCRVLELPPGTHVLTALFAYGNHVPYDPPILDRVLITVEE